MSLATPSFVESHFAFLFMKDGVSSLWGKDFIPRAFIPSSMLSQSNYDMLREATLRTSMDSIVRFQAQT